MLLALRFPTCLRRRVRGGRSGLRLAVRQLAIAWAVTSPGVQACEPCRATAMEAVYTDGFLSVLHVLSLPLVAVLMIACAWALWPSKRLKDQGR